MKLKSLPYLIEKIKSLIFVNFQIFQTVRYRFFFTFDAYNEAKFTSIPTAEIYTIKSMIFLNF